MDRSLTLAAPLITDGAKLHYCSTLDSYITSYRGTFLRHTAALSYVIPRLDRGIQKVAPGYRGRTRAAV